jgi:hypothetical protein
LDRRCDLGVALGYRIRHRLHQPAVVVLRRGTTDCPELLQVSAQTGDVDDTVAILTLYRPLLAGALSSS